MILYDRQYEALQKNLSKIKASVAEFEAIDDKVGVTKLQEFQALKGISDEIQQEINDYLRLKSGKFLPPKSFELSELPKILIQTRIALGWTQEDLADLLKMDYARIKRYEEEEYFGASFSKLLQIADVLKIEIDQCFREQGVNNEGLKIWKNTNDVNWKEFPVNEAIKRGWVEKNDGETSTEAFKAWFTDSIGRYTTFTRQLRKTSQDYSMQDKRTLNSLLTWQARVLQVADEEIKTSQVNEFKLDDRWIKELVEQTVHEDGPKRARDLLKNHGIMLIIEKHLPKTYLDGAAMLSHEGIPVVGLTLRYDRLDYFWFTLFHELGHVYCHLFDRKNIHVNYFDQDSSKDQHKDGQTNLYSGDESEEQANWYATKLLIEAKTWETCQSRVSASKESVLTDAKRLGIHPSIIAGRIRNERKDFSMLNDLTGQGQLRKHFKEY